MLSNTLQTKYKPFHHSLPQTPKRSFRGQQQQKLLLRKGITSKYSKKWYNNANQNSYGYRYGKYKPGNPTKESGISLCSSSGGSKTNTSLNIKSLFCTQKIPNVQLAGRLKNFTENWEILTNDTDILSLVEGYTIPFPEIHQQKNILNSPKLRHQEEKILVQKEILVMLNKGAIVETLSHLEGEFISNPFLVEKICGIDQ